MGQCASQPRTFPGGDEPGSVVTPDGSRVQQQQHKKGAVAATSPAAGGRSFAAKQLQPPPSPGPQLDASLLDDDTLGGVLAGLPLGHLVQLSVCSRRLHRLVCRSDKVLTSADLQQLPPQQQQPALAFLAAHPAADALHAAVLPSNLPGSGAALGALTNLTRLTLFRAAKAPLPEPDIWALGLERLGCLNSLALTLASGDVPAGRCLPLPHGLRSLSIEAPSFGAAINPLELSQLSQLSHLALSVMDSSSTKALTKLHGLHGLQHLSLGRFWVLPDVLHGFASLRVLEVSLYGKVPRAPQGSLELPLSAAVCGLTGLPTRPSLQLKVSIAVLAESDGLAPDWAALPNLRSLALDNIYPCTSGRGFSLAPLAGLGRLGRLSLGFEAQLSVAGQYTRLPLHDLHALVHLKELSVTSSGPWVEVALEAPRHLASLMVATQGPLLLAAPGSAAAAAAAAARRAAAANPSQVVMRLSFDAAAPASPPGSPSAGSHNGLQQLPPAHKAAAPQAQQHHGLAAAAARLLPAGLQPAGSLTSVGSGSLAGAGSYSSSSGLASPAGSYTGGGPGCGKDPLAGLELGSDASLLLAARRLDRLGSIGESEEAYDEDDEAQQLSHIPRLGLLTGGGIRVLDPKLTPADLAGAARAGSASFGRTGSGAGRRLARQLSGGGGGKDADAGPLPLDAWLSAKGLDLSALQLVQQAAMAPADSSAAPSSGKGGGKGGRPRGGAAVSAATADGCVYSLLARQHMEGQLLQTFRQWGFAR